MNLEPRRLGGKGGGGLLVQTVMVMEVAGVLRVPELECAETDSPPKSKPRPQSDMPPSDPENIPPV